MPDGPPIAHGHLPALQPPAMGWPVWASRCSSHMVSDHTHPLKAQNGRSDSGQHLPNSTGYRARAARVK